MQANGTIDCPLCICGCGARLPDVRRPKPGRRYIRGHQWRSPLPDYTVDLATGCWVWQRSNNGRGYGFAYRNGARIYAHRAFYEDRNGPIPAGLVIDHLCRNPSCVNPEHLEVVLQRENMRRAHWPTSRPKPTPREFCRKGLHRFTPENTIIDPSRGRVCRECRRVYKREWYLRRRSSAARARQS